MEGPVGIPERENRHVVPPICTGDILVVSAVTAVHILEEEGMQGGMIDTRIEGLPQANIIAIQFVFPEFLLPAVFGRCQHTPEIGLRHFGKVFQGTVDAGGRYRHLHLYALPFLRGKTHESLQAGSPGFQMTAESFRIVNDRFTILEDPKIGHRTVETGGEENISFRTPSAYDFAAHDGIFIPLAHAGPRTLPIERMVQIHHHKSIVAGRIGKAEDAAAVRRRHFRLDAAVLQQNTIITGVCPLLVVYEPRRSRVLPHSRKEQEIAQVRDARSAQVRQAESLDGGLGILVAGCRIIILVVGIRADLDAPEGHLGTGVNVPEAIGPHKRIHVVYQTALGAQAQAKADSCQEKKGFAHISFRLYRSWNRVYPLLPARVSCRVWPPSRIPASRRPSGRRGSNRVWYKACRSAARGARNGWCHLRREP